jgi:hypothetical protein
MMKHQCDEYGYADATLGFEDTRFSVSTERCEFTMSLFNETDDFHPRPVLHEDVVTKVDTPVFDPNPSSFIGVEGQTTFGVDGPYMCFHYMDGATKGTVRFKLHEPGSTWNLTTSTGLLHRLFKCMGKAHGTISYHEQYVVFSWSNLWVAIVAHTTTTQ